MDRTYKIPSHFLDDLCSRFILNIPDEYKDDIIRTFFQMELAHWFYIDFLVPEHHGLKIIGIKEFANQVFDHCPFLVKGLDDVDTLHQDWKKYKLAVPKYGVILLDPSKCYVLLVQGFSKSWGFPKGKVNENEEPVKCALRELLEETGCDASGSINPAHYLEHSAGDQYSRLYIVPGIPLETHFMPLSRNEIRAMKWFPLDMLPTHKKDVSNAEQLGVGPNAFFMVIPFVKPLKRWIAQSSGRMLRGSPAMPGAGREKKSQAQIEFAKKSVHQFEELLRFDNTSPNSKRSPDKTSGRRQGRRNHPGYSNTATKSPQYVILQKDRKEESIKKLHQIKQSLDISQTAGASKPPVKAKKETYFKSSKEWRSFKLDIGAIMESL